MDDFVPPDTHENTRLHYFSAEDQEEIRRIIGPTTEPDREFMKKMEKHIKSEEKFVDEKLLEAIPAEFDRLRPRFKVTISSELAEWKRFQKLSEAEKQAKIAENCEEIRRYLLTREKFLEDLQKRFKINLEQCDSEDSESDVENEQSESDSEDSEDSEEDVSDEEEEEEPTEDWREMWLKETGEPWPNFADQIWGPSTNPKPSADFTIVDAVKMMSGVPKKEEEPMGKEQKMDKPCLFEPGQIFYSSFFDAQKSTKLEEKVFEKLPLPRPNRLESDSDLSFSSGGDDVADCSFQSSALNDFFASRPATPINRETPEKLVPDFEKASETEIDGLLRRFVTPDNLDSEAMTMTTTTSRILEATPKTENSRGRAMRPPTSSKSAWNDPKNPKNSSKLAQKRVESQMTTKNTAVNSAKRAKSTVVEKREMPRRAARERPVSYFEAGEGGKERKIENPKARRPPPPPPKEGPSRKRDTRRPPTLTQFPTLDIKLENFE